MMPRPHRLHDGGDAASDQRLPVHLLPHSFHGFLSLSLPGSLLGSLLPDPLLIRSGCVK